MFIKVKEYSKKNFSDKSLTELAFANTATIRDVKKEIMPFITIAGWVCIRNKWRTFKDNQKLSDIYKRKIGSECSLILYCAESNDFICRMSLYPGDNEKNLKDIIDVVIKEPPSPTWHVPSQSFDDTINDECISVGSSLSSSSSSSSNAGSESSDDEMFQDKNIPKTMTNNDISISKIKTENGGGSGDDAIQKQPTVSNDNFKNGSNEDNINETIIQKSSIENGGSGDDIQKHSTVSNDNNIKNSPMDKPDEDNIYEKFIQKSSTENGGGGNAIQKHSTVVSHDNNINENESENKSYEDSNKKIIQKSPSSDKKRNSNQEDELLPMKKRICADFPKMVFKNTNEDNEGALVPLVTEKITSSRDESAFDINFSCTPCGLIPPQMRKFVAVVVKTSSYDEFFERCFIEFFKNNSSSVSELQFDANVPICIHPPDGSIWIACKDDYTLDWILKNFNFVGDDGVNKIDKLQNHYDYRRYTVVVPNFQDRRFNLHEIFRILENQNAQLNTTKWIFEGQQIVEKTEEAVEGRLTMPRSLIILSLQIDNESEEYLKGKSFELKYCFWKILFKVEAVK